MHWTACKGANGIESSPCLGQALKRHRAVIIWVILQCRVVVTDVDLREAKENVTVKRKNLILRITRVLWALCMFRYFQEPSRHTIAKLSTKKQILTRSGAVRLCFQHPGGWDSRITSLLTARGRSMKRRGGGYSLQSGKKLTKEQRQEYKPPSSN